MKHQPDDIILPFLSATTFPPHARPTSAMLANVDFDFKAVRKRTIKTVPSLVERVARLDSGYYLTQSDANPSY